MLYGTSSADWNFVTYSEGVGALDYTVQQITKCLFLNNLGVTELRTSQVYGNFEDSTLTKNINTFIKSEHTKVAYSSISKERSQYRLFFSDGYALYLTMLNGKYIGGSQVYFDNAVYCACADNMANGDEVLYFGSASGGYVYQLDKGTSFDGADINGYVTLNWNHCGSPRILKRWRKASMEMQGSGYAEISFGYSMSYNSTNEIQPMPKNYVTNFSSTNWDTAGITWEQFQWDGKTLSPTEIEMNGTSENMQPTISFGSDYMMPFTLNSLILHFTPRRGMR
jgi:hypothetical protein